MCFLCDLLTGTTKTTPNINESKRKYKQTTSNLEEANIEWVLKPLKMDLGVWCTGESTRKTSLLCSSGPACPELRSMKSKSSGIMVTSCQHSFHIMGRRHHQRLRVEVWFADFPHLLFLSLWASPQIWQPKWETEPLKRSHGLEGVLEKPSVGKASELSNQSSWVSYGSNSPGSVWVHDDVSAPGNACYFKRK